jgi:hypothetical protein
MACAILRRILMIVKISLAVLLTAFAQTTSPANVATLHGIVVREGTSEPLAGAKITVGGVSMNFRQAQAVLSSEATGQSIPPEAINAARAVIAAQAAGGNSTPVAPLTAVTDSEGRFVIPGVPAGNVSVRAELEGFFGSPSNGIFPDSAYASVAIEADKPANVKLSLVPGGTISGRVFDASGKPFFNAIVATLRPAYTRGVMSLSPVSGKQTDDRGEFRLYPLAPGEYYVMVTPRLPGARATDIPSAPEIQVATLFPNATTLDGATKVVVPMGEEARGIDVRVRTAPTSTVSGHVTSNYPPIAPRVGRGGAPIPTTATLALASREPGGFSDVIGGMTAVANADGSFQIPNVTPGLYDLYARMPIANGWGGLAPPERATNAAAFGRASIEVRGGNIAGVQIVIHQGMDVRGRITVDGTPKQARVLLNMIPDDSIDRVGDAQTSSVYTQVTQYRPVIAPDGSFTIPVVPEGHYRFGVQIQEPGNVYVADIRQGSTSVYDNGLQVGAQAINPLEVDIRTNAGTLEAVVLGSDQKPAAGKTVVLVPAAQRRQNPSLYKVANSDPQGNVLLTNLAPGQYKLFALDNVSVGAWMNAEFIAKVEGRGTSVTINAGSRQSAQAKLIAATAD